MKLQRRQWLSCFLASALTCLLPAQQAPSASSRSSTHRQAAAPDPGQINNSLYRNPFFGFSYKLPFGWVDRTAEMREAASDPAKGLVMLAVFEHPPEAKTATVNSSVVIAAENAGSYTGLKSAAQYFGPLNEVVTQQGLKVVNEPYEFPVDARSIVRCDYSKDLGGASLHQSTLALLTKGYVVSLTFIGGSEDELTELIEGLKFGLTGRPAKDHAANSHK